jgi:DNA-binding transcriptional LysR family regulator
LWIPLFACVPAVFDEGQSSISLADLLEKPVILLSKTTAVGGLIDETLEALAVRLDVQFEVQAATTALAPAASGLGIAIVSQVALVPVRVWPSFADALTLRATSVEHQRFDGSSHCRPCHASSAQRPPTQRAPQLRSCRYQAAT